MVFGILALLYLALFTLQSTIQEHVFIGDPYFNRDLEHSTWTETIWNPQSNSYVRIENGIADFFYNETEGENWGASILFQGAYPHNGPKGKDLLADPNTAEISHKEAITFNSVKPIPEGKYLLKAKWKIVSRGCNINSSTKGEPKGNVGFELICQINDLDYNAEYRNNIRIALVFSGFIWNGSEFEEVEKGIYWVQRKGIYDPDIHITFFVDEVKRVGEWQFTEIDLGYYINRAFELVKDEGVSSLTVRCIQLYAEGIGIYINAQFDFVEIQLRH